ncbi:MAG: aminoglycoside phosphotransferase family protein [Opitutales bacterium]|nr:aminoglycoside phosphotransferase family protein [Opitutales bacterium]
MSLPLRKFAEIGWVFGLKGDLVSAEPYGSGHINDTYLLVYSQAGTPMRYILQRINNEVFHSIPNLMENIQRVTEHIRVQLDAEAAKDCSRKVLTVLRQEDGSTYFKDSGNSYWRIYYFIEGAVTYDKLEWPEQARAAAAAFGDFQKYLAGLSGPPLHDTIPDFHHTIKRFERFNKVVAADPLNRSKEAVKEIEGYRFFADWYGLILNGLERGDLPERVTHNDSKLNNVMIDNASGEGICVIDLDTVMKGSALYDFGDLVRSATNAGMEDEADPDKVFMREDVFAAIVEGYLGQARSFLVPAEVELLAPAGLIITLEIGMRFLTDYIEGDVYFKKRRSGHNLDRARNQLLLAQSMHRKLDWMQTLVEGSAH